MTNTEPGADIGTDAMGVFTSGGNILLLYYQDIHRPLLREEGDGAPASSGTQ